MRALNQRFRQKDKSTDVLSFPAAANGAGPGRVSKNTFAGEIAISSRIAAANARKLGHPLAAELKVLLLHGMLHLAGHDHERDNGAMARKEETLRRAFGLPSSLIARASRTATRNSRQAGWSGATKSSGGSAATKRKMRDA